MSYDISLCDPVTKETLELPVKHMMIGGTHHAELVNGRLQAAPTSEAWLNITYNYGHYYYEALEGDKDYNSLSEMGIRCLYDKSGAESIPILDKMIENIKKKYPDLETDIDYWKDTPGNAIKPLYQLKAMASLRPDGIWQGD